MTPDYAWQNPCNSSTPYSHTYPHPWFYSLILIGFIQTRSIQNVMFTCWQCSQYPGIRLQDISARIRFGQDPIRPEKTWTFRPKAWTFRPRNIDVSAKEDGRFGQKRWTFRPEKMDISAKYIFNSFTNRVLLLVGVITDWTVSVQWTRSCITERLRTSIRVTSGYWVYGCTDVFWEIYYLKVVLLSLLLLPWCHGGARRTRIDSS